MRPSDFRRARACGWMWKGRKIWKWSGNWRRRRSGIELRGCQSAAGTRAGRRSLNSTGGLSVCGWRTRRVALRLQAGLELLNPAGKDLMLVGRIAAGKLLELSAIDAVRYVVPHTVSTRG